ncbi:MAG: zinc/iron-chelating domain-containing protein [Nitrospira sp. WS110]|nr:zinc/iron-chelating domain-containing protein [Nitrospira sp. WS110]
MLQERFEIALNTPAGQITSAVDVPTGNVSVSAVVPLMRRLGEEAQALEVVRSLESGKAVSCHKGCAACCRMLVPLSGPEAFALRDWIRSRPTDQQEHIARRFSEAKTRLLAQGVWQQLAALCESPLTTDEDRLEGVNRSYYALRLPCPFLEEEMCTIYDERPAACRELLVTSPSDRCDDLTKNPIDPVAVPIQVSTVLGLVWQELTADSTRLIPLPLALEWAEGHDEQSRRTWRGGELFDQALDKTCRFLSQAFATSDKDPTK